MNLNLTELDFMQECYIRGLYQADQKMTQKYKYFSSGYQGEKVMFDWLCQHLPAHATILHDFWIEYRGVAQVDLLVLINNIIWVIEVKHYNGYFQYEDKVCLINGYRMDKDHLSQMRNRLLIMKDIIKQNSKDFELIGTMIFTHENSEISIPPEPTFDTLTLNQVKRYLDNKILPKINRNNSSILSHLKKFQTNSRFLMPTLKDNDYTFIKKGVYCAKCFSFNIRTNNRYMFCEECNYKEIKREAMIRQYCCQGVLQHQKTYITNKAIHNLSNKSFSSSHLREILKLNLQHTIEGKHIAYYNYALPYSKYLKKY